MSTRKVTAAAETLRVENGGRPPVQVWGSCGMASSMHPMATDAAVQILRQGGNAVDAAIALGAAISVTSHDWSGIAGDSAWLGYWAATGEYFYLDGYATCPRACTAETLQHHFNLDSAKDRHAFQEEPPECRNTGVITAMIPGTPAAWDELAQRFGSLPFAQLCAPAIALAERGFPINRFFAQQLAGASAKLLPYGSSRRIMCRADGSLVGEGATLRQPDLAATLRRLAERGRAGFYEGETAQLIVDYCRRHGGLLTAEDLTHYKPVWRDVLRGSYRDSEVIVTSPPTAGVHVIQALNILEGFDLSALEYHSAESLHLLIESVKLALADRRSIGGDPDFLPMDLKRLTSKREAEQLRKSVQRERARSLSAHEFSGSSTTHFVVADRAGNIVHATQTLGSIFGCGEVVEGTGMFMNNRTWWMALAGSPNTVAPGRRANIGHAPTMLGKAGRPYAALGAPGGFGIVQFVAQTVVNMLDYGLDIQSAIEAPRFRVENLAGRVGIEKRISTPVRKKLADMGHKVFDYEEWADRAGAVEGVFIDSRTGNMLGGYDPRRNSSAAGLGWI